MALFYLTGVSGVGKSTVLSKLAALGYRVQDADEDGFSSFQNVRTGEYTERPAALKDRTSVWYEENQWNLKSEKVLNLLRSAENTTVFLCGYTFNQSSFFSLFKEVFCLQIDERNLRKRIRERTSNDFGKIESELKEILRWHKTGESRCKEQGAIMVDASQPIEATVRVILSKLH